MTRNYTIDSLRTIATLLVVLLHVAAGYVYAGQRTGSFDASFWIGNTVDSFCRICVPLFVLISGMFLVGRQEPIKVSYQKRARRILLPLIAWTIIYIAYRFLAGVVIGPPITTDRLLNYLIIGKPFYHLWYLYMIIGLYLITPFLNYSIAALSRKTIWTIAVVLMLFGMLHHTYNFLLGNQPFFLIWFMDYLGYFLLGYLMKDTNKKIAPSLLIAIYIVCSGIIAVLNYYTTVRFNNFYFYAYLTPFVILASLSIYQLFHQLELKDNLLAKVSHLTLGVYLIHAGILDLLNRGVRIFDLQLFREPLLGIPLKFVVVLTLSFLLAAIISKIKYLNKLI